MTGRQLVRTLGLGCAVLGLAALGLAPVAAQAASTTVIGVTLTTPSLSDALTPQPGIALGAVSSASEKLTVDDAETYQSLDGFGAAFTDTSDYLLSDSLSAATREQIMNELFSPTTGIGLSLMRVPMGSSDYTATPASDPSTYSYDDNGGVADPTLANFSITLYNDLDGTAWHCYANDLGNMTTIHDSYPGKALLET
jgi:glucosylceramidase